MKKTLLQKAQAIATIRKALYVLTEEHQDAAIAWMKGEVTTTQVARAMGKKPGEQSGNMLYMFAQALKSAYQKGRLSVKK